MGVVCKGVACKGVVIRINVFCGCGLWYGFYCFFSLPFSFISFSPFLSFTTSLSLSLCFYSLQIPEYCQLVEYDVRENAFELIFAFDEIVALGYRESVNLAQIRTFTEMDSHEERVYEAMRKVGIVGG